MAARPGSAWGSRTAGRSAGFSWIRRIRISSSSRRWVMRTGPTRNVAFSARGTAERPGRASSSTTRTPERSTWPSIPTTRERSSPPCGRRADRPGTSTRPPTAPAAVSIDPRMEATPGSRSPRACPPRNSAGSESRSLRACAAASTPWWTRRPADCTCPTTPAFDGGSRAEIAASGSAAGTSPA